MIRLVAHILEGATATVELDTPQAVVDYMAKQDHQPVKWEFDGSLAEEAKIVELCAAHPVLQQFTKATTT